MNCGEFHDTVQQFLDGEVVGPCDAFEAHRAQCRECRELYSAAVELARGLRLVAWPLPAVGLAGQVTVAVQSEHIRGLRARRLLTTAALAASLMVAVTAVAFLPRPGPQPAIDATSITATNPPVIIETAAVLAVDENLSTAGSALTSLVEVTARRTVKQGQALIGESVATPKLADIDALQQSLEPPAQSLRQAGQNLTASLEPVTSSARRAFLTFVQDLSPMGESQ